MSAGKLGVAAPAPAAAPAEAHHEAAEAAARLAAGAHHVGTGNAALAAFFAAFTRYASPEDINRYSGAELAALVRIVFAKTVQRAPGASLIETFDPAAEDKTLARSETIVLAVNDDMPFLYDSCTAEVRARGLRIRAAFHPLIPLAHRPDSAHREKGAPVKESVIVLALDHIAEDETRDALKQGLERVLGHVRIAVRDWKPMRARLHETVEALKRNPPEIAKDELDESLAFLGWLDADHFTFLGARDYHFHSEGEGSLDADYESGLGLLADPEARVIRRGADRSSLTPEVREFLVQPSPLIIAKSNVVSAVHRRVHMDYIGVKLFDGHGALTGERRFVGLFTSTAYAQPPGAIPLLRRKVAQVLAGAGLPRNSHDGKSLAHILDTFPRDELFQIGEDELLATATSILNLGQRPKVRVFLRFDKFDRYVSALVFVPRERYNTSIRKEIHAILAGAFDGRMSAAHPMLDDETMARVHYIVGRNGGPRPHVDVRELETEIRAAVRTWEDGFADMLAAKFGEKRAATIARKYGGAFPPDYRDIFAPTEAGEDISCIESLTGGNSPGGDVLAHVSPHSDETQATLLRLKLFVRGDYVPLSDCLPVFENLGLRVIAEDPFSLTPLDKDGRTEAVALQSFLMARNGSAAREDLAALKPRLEEAFHAIWLGRAESDGFNRLVVEAEMNWRDASILRAAAKFLRQAGLTFNQTYMEAALAKNPQPAMLLIDLFYALQEPGALGAHARKESANAVRERLDAALDDVPSADEDRIIRAFAAVIGAMLRTNFFQEAEDGGAKPALAFKLDSLHLPMLPAPKPFVEIFVYAPDVEGVHLRFGPVARGGLRWSDRAEDFRTEILSLVKAQQVKNAVIVPVGAKGGFYPKALPKNGSREDIQRAGIAAYKTFIGALLDLTDNIGPNGEIVPPQDTVRHDGDDPYLVVAADKGTASFSDIANAIAEARGFWLGDAFASGGSKGYDHKTMGITARGAWEAVKRHFRELGRDIQNEPFTCVGVGDMSGDVFGNAMLLSQKTKLIAAFDHRHIFFDPDPDPGKSWDERKRLFELKRSSWDDYDKSLISKGGMVAPRSAKSIRLTAELKKLTGLEQDDAAPQDIIHTMLAAPADLLFFGGIGTYIKAQSENHAEAGDRANDALRIDGRNVRAAVIGEGANLGATQKGRIEYARHGGTDGKGGRINTDAIDNSAGVDTSDHEVNLKILMNGPVRRGELEPAARDDLLADMTGDVARLVLQNNYDQTLAISVAAHGAADSLDASARLIRELERAGKLDRAVEMLPGEEAIRARARDGMGLTRPEIAVLLAYAKLDLFGEVAASALPGDPYFAGLLRDYFPRRAAERFESELERHRLKHEIIGTQLVNRAVNLAGPLYAHRMRELSGAPLWCAARAFALADGAFELSQLKTRIDALDLKVAAAVQYGLMADLGQLLRRLGLWFATQVPPPAPLAETIAAYGEGVAALKGELARLASPLETEAVKSRFAALSHAGVPQQDAEEFAAVSLLGAVPEIVLLGATHRVPIAAAAGAFFAMGEIVGLDYLRVLAGRVAAADHWDRLALRRIADDLYAAQRLLSGQALRAATSLSGNSAASDGATAVKSWTGARQDEIARSRAFVAELQHGGAPTVAKLTLAHSQIQKIAAQAG